MSAKSIHSTHVTVFIALLLSLSACEQKSSHKVPDQDTTQLAACNSSGLVSLATTEEVDAGIRKHIREKTEEGGGFFHAGDSIHDLNLKLVRVHTEYIAKLGPEYNFACVDLADENGDVYDLDFFLRGKPGAMKVCQTTIHKLNGKPYYTWRQRKEDKTWYTVPLEDASEDLLGVKEGSDAFVFHYEATLPEITGKARMWLPIAQSDSFQTIEIVTMEVPGNYKEVKDNKCGNTLLYSELGPEDSNKNLNIVYRVHRIEKSAYVDNTNAEDYLAADDLIPVGGRFKEIADSAIAKSHADTKLTEARALYDYLIDNMSYKKAWKYGTGDANFACDSRFGNCTEFHSFFLSLARSSGIPARFAIGAAIPSSRDEGGVNGYHCWAEFYADGKWWPLDISEGNKFTPLATYYFGHHPANRIELSHGRDLAPEPAPQSEPIHFLAYPFLEMGGKKVKVKTTFSFERKG